MKRSALAALVCLAAVFLGLLAVKTAIRLRMPDYPDAIGLDPNVAEKITGTWLARQAAAEGDLLVFGSSELKTTDICTHPARVFADRRCGFQLSLIGRGSCQSLVHALCIAGSGDALSGKKAVLITSPQSFVPEGIAPDLFLGNFSELELLNALSDSTIPPELRQYLAARVRTLLAQYRESYGGELYRNSAGELLAEAVADGSALRTALLRPYAGAVRWMLDAKDLLSARRVMRGYGDSPSVPAPIDWQAEEVAALAQAEEMSASNDFGMLDGYYSTYIGRKLAQFEGKDADLSYAESPEYDDLRCLLALCRVKGIEVLFVHVPMHGAWFDYTGFSAQERSVYYQKVREIVSEYDNVTLLDLTDCEYEPYFLCDIMHLGWKGWLAVDRAIADFAQQNQ